MNWDRVSGNWKQMKGKIKEQWGKLTDDEIEQIAGNREQLEGKDPKALRHRQGSGQEADRRGHPQLVADTYLSPGFAPLKPA